jgi:hypothetical protein
VRVTPPDLEDWFVRHVRAQAQLDGIDAEVGNKEPVSLRLPLARPLIVIRDDSGPRLDWTTFDRSIGATVLAGSRQNDKPANDVARWLAAVLLDDALPLVLGSPIASVEWDGSNGPYAVPESLDVARRYMTAQYVVSGSW